MKAAYALLGMFVLGCFHPALPESPRAHEYAKERQPGAQADAVYSEKIRAQAEDMHRLLLSGNLEGFVGYMLPQVVEMAGGAEAMKQAIQPGLAEMPKQVEKITIGTISPVVAETDGGLAAIVPIEMILKIQGTRIIKTSYYVARSIDRGVSWKFLASQGQPGQEQFVKQLFPELTSQVPFPKCEMRQIK